jgi:hypothetical protein
MSENRPFKLRMGIQMENGGIERHKKDRADDGRQRAGVRGDARWAHLAFVVLGKSLFQLRIRDGIGDGCKKKTMGR